MDKSFYKGYSTDPFKRLQIHNRGLSRYTSKKIPWRLVFVQECENKTEALKREKQLKKANSDYLDWLIRHSDVNLIR
jgi:putative endonuclease